MTQEHTITPPQLIRFMHLLMNLNFFVIRSTHYEVQQ